MRKLIKNDKLNKLEWFQRINLHEGIALAYPQFLTNDSR
jgi:hypothetical protein